MVAVRWSAFVSSRATWILFLFIMTMRRWRMTDGWRLSTSAASDKPTRNRLYCLFNEKCYRVTQCVPNGIPLPHLFARVARSVLLHTWHFDCDLERNRGCHATWCRAGGVMCARKTSKRTSEWGTYITMHESIGKRRTYGGRQTKTSLNFFISLVHFSQLRR